MPVTCACATASAISMPIATAAAVSIVCVPKALAQRLPRHVLHDDAGAAVDVEDVVDGGNAAVIQLCGRPRLANAPHAFVRAVGPGEQLEGHVALEAQVARAVDFAPAAASDGLPDGVPTDGSPWRKLILVKHGRKPC